MERHRSCVWIEARLAAGQRWQLNWIDTWTTARVPVVPRFCKTCLIHVGWGKLVAQLIPREGLQLYSLADEPLPTQAQQPYTHAAQKAFNTIIL
jgi:hypothetical protein